MTLLFEKVGHMIMPGYTYMQKAMPTIVGDMAGSIQPRWIMTSTKCLIAYLYILIKNPIVLVFQILITTSELWFAKTQKIQYIVVYHVVCLKILLLQALSPVMILAGKSVNDMLLFTTSEFGFVLL